MQHKSSIDAKRRQKILEYATKHGITEAAVRYHVSRKTVHKWKKRYNGTLESLEDRSRRPNSSPNRATEEELGHIRRRMKQCRWTDYIYAYQICVERDGYSKSYASFRQAARKLKSEKRKKKPTKKCWKPYQRADYPGQKIQLDVKYVPTECILDGNRYYQYTAVDECTRWTFREMYGERSTFSSMDFLKKLLKAAPFPIRTIQTDNGVEFTNALLVTKAKHKTLFEEALEKMGIEYKRIQIATPRHNGKVERQHRIDSERFYSQMRMFNLKDGRAQLAIYQKKSNNIIKSCLNMQTPNQVVEQYLGVM